MVFGGEQNACIRLLIACSGVGRFGRPVSEPRMKRTPHSFDKRMSVQQYDDPKTAFLRNISDRTKSEALGHT